jgi:hypothetical protein
MPDFERDMQIPNGLAERIDRVRGEEPFEHWVRHQIEASVLGRERALGLLSAEQRDQIDEQDSDLERRRDTATADRRRRAGDRRSTLSH